MSLFSLAYTSVRPEWIVKCAEVWKTRSAIHDFELVIAVDANKPESIKAAKSVPGAKVVIQDKEPFNCVRGWNLAAEHTTGKIIIAVADDFNPPEGWDELILNSGPNGWPDGEHVMHVEDGYVHDIFVLAILTRKRYERFGYLFYPQYESMFSDTEFTETAHRDGVVIEARHLLFEHLHPDCGKRDRDVADLHHASRERWNRGQMLFNFRKARGFPLDDGPKAVIAQIEAPVEKKRNYCAYLQVNRDDLCLFEVCSRLMEEGVNTFFYSIPTHFWSGEAVPQSDISAVQDIAKRLRDKGAVVHEKFFKVSNYTFAGDSRITVETRLRNDALTWIRNNGFRDIIIVDGDELWLPGTLKMIEPYIDQGHLAISTRMIPVIGLPGYPVDSATDVAVVYIGGNVVFKCCRTPTVQQTVVPNPCIIHFTGTRRTMQETIDKHRRSGHYDDPDYDFEGWITNTLPNIKPGMRNAHMYKPFQIWPLVRDFRPNEVAAIPDSLAPYLGVNKN